MSQQVQTLALPTDTPDLATVARLNLTRGQVAIVTTEDLGRARACGRWQAMLIGRTWYAGRPTEHKGVRQMHYLHRMVWEWHCGPIPEGYLIDHIDGDGLNCLPSNLRLATVSQNNANGIAHGLSRYRGVCYFKPTRRWRARIACRGVSYWLGYYATEEDAALAYDRAARELFGEFARCNFPEEGEDAA